MSAPASSTQGRDPSKVFNDVKGTVAAVERGDWVSAGLGMANTAMDIVGMAGNPLSGFLSAGFSWAIEHVSFLREPFDALLGDPQAIAKMAESWKSAGTQVASVASDYRQASVQQTSTWLGRSADSYRSASANHSTGLDTLSKAANGISGAVAGAGQLVAAVRKIIMDLISQAVADMVMKIIQWLAASILTFGAAIGAAIADIVQMAVRYAKKLSDFLSKLASSLTKLMNLVKQVAQIAQVAKQVIQAITAMSHKGASGGGAAGANTRPSAGGLGMTAEQIDQIRRNADQRYTTPGSGGTTGASGASGGGSAGAPVSAPPSVGGSGGHWEPGRWVPDPAGGQVSAPPSVGGGGGAYPGAPTVPGGAPVRQPYQPAAARGDLHPSAGSGGLPTSFPGGGGGGGAIPGGGGGGGAMPGGFSGGGGFSAGGGGGAGAGGGPTQPGGATGIIPSATPGNAPAGGGMHGPAGGGGAGGGGAAGGGMMGGAPMGGAGGQGGGGKDHQRKIRIEGEALIDPPKAAKPVIGE
jgi:uncharacterized protein YukE